jgi:hypothetical protein
MWLLLFAGVLQIAVILELFLNRIIAILCNSRRNDVRKLADGSFCGSMLALVTSVLTVPVSIAAAAAQLFVNYFMFWVGLLLVVAILAALSETSSVLVALYVNAYNAGVGQALNELVVFGFEIFAPFWRAVVPIYNAVAYIIVGFSVDVLLPIVLVNAKLVPDFILNFTVMMGSVGVGLSEWMTRIVTCTGQDIYNDNATSPFWVNDLSCVGNPHYLTLDLMTPALYAQRGATTLQQILTTSCVPITNTLTLAIYPLLDINLYKAIHGLVNSVLHSVIGIHVLTKNRCTYARTTKDYVYTDAEKRGMCMPDIAPLTTTVVSGLRSAGTLVDNWLDTALMVVENSATGVVRSCTPPSLALVWRNASDVLGTSSMRVVGLTPSLYAITDADSIVYHSMVGASLRVAYALHAWPFKVDLRLGVAAVRYNTAPDIDDEGNGRTGMLACRCVDADNAGLQIMCASVPYQHHLADDENQHHEFTVHRVRFVPDSARVGLTCATVDIRVQSLRFSRRRFSEPGVGRVELGFEDGFNTRLQYGAREAVDHTADAAIVVTPMCAVHASVLCVPSIENCFPFCLGLHAAGQRSQNISLMNAQRWDEWTSIGQTDCIVANANGGACTAASLVTRLLQNDEAGVEISGCAKTACMPDAASVTFIKNSEQGEVNRSLVAWQTKQPWGFVRSRLQPFIAAGDVFLYQNPTDDVSGQILVTRLYDNKRGDFSLQQEQLTLLTNSVPMEYRQCLDEACYLEQLRANRIVLPFGYFDRGNPTIAAASEWAVHWTATPSSKKCAPVLDFCADTSRDQNVLYTAHKPRLWTVRTVRSPSPGGLGRPFSEEALASYMIIPDWFSCSKDDFVERTQCSRMYNMKVVGLEYINADNLLLTVLAATPKDWDWQNDAVFDGRPFEYRFYFVHPNRHDCTNAEEPETLYTCWKSADDGIFSAPSKIVESGALCPMLQRMPRWGSMVTEVVVAQVYLAKFLLDFLLVMPLIVHGNMDELFEQRTRPTFHTILDASGNTLFNLEDALKAMELSAFHAASTIARTGTLMQSLGVPELETVLVGTARVFEYTTAASKVEDRVFGQSGAAVSGQYNRLLSSFGSTTTDGAPISTPGVPVSLTSQASSRWVRVFQSIAGPSVSWLRISAGILRKILVKAIRNGQFRRLVARDMASSLITSVYESEQDISHGLFDNMKIVCDASGQVVGRTNSWGQAVRHSCMLVPESMQSVIRVILVLTIDYQVMDCVCKQTEGFVVEEILNNVCLPRILPMARKAFVMQAITDRSVSACFTVMDSVNDKLMRAFEPVFARMVKAQQAIESAFGLLVTQVLGMDALDMKCTDHTSPFVVSIMPEPVDYFMGCMMTFECRARCLDSMSAFEEALTAYKVYSPTPLAYVGSSTIETESRFFSYADMEEGKHLAPFAVYAVTQLPDSICGIVCPTQQARCVAASGIRRAELTVAYYCVPASLVMSVYAGVEPEATKYSVEPLRARSVLDIQFATVYKRELGNAEWLVVLARDRGSHETSVWVVPSDVPEAAWQIIETEKYNSATTRTRDAEDKEWPVETISSIYVLPAHAQRTTASVFIIGSLRTDDGTADALFCYYVLINTAFDGTAIDSTRHNCINPLTTVYSDRYRTVCLDYDCREVVRVPIDGSSEVRLQTLRGYAANSSAFDWHVTSSRIVYMPQDERRLLDIDDAALLSTSQDATLQFTRRTLSPFGSITGGSFGSNQTTIDVPVTGRGKVDDTWLQNVRLRLSVDANGEPEINLRVSASFTTKQRMQTVVNCSVSSCAGCHGTHPLQVDLQNKCFAAASCGIAQCVGTPVNMKRPMCQIASILGLQIAFVRVNMEGFWDFFSRSIITIVELTQARRQKYEISTAQETTMATVCSAKDGIVQTFATFGALYAQIPALTLDRASREPVSLQELRYNTERVMVATAVVELLSQVGLGVVYIPLVSAKIMQCQLNDAFLVIEGFGTAIAQGTTKADVVKFRMGSEKFDKIDDFAVGMCLTDRFKQDLRDISDPAREQSMLTGLQDIFDGITGLIVQEKYGGIAFAFDAVCSWILGMLSGAMNLMQVVDSENCRLPVVDTIVVGSCVCGDVPARIPDKQRSSKRTDALWCRGPLMMTTVLANDVLVWNPFSLSELLAQNKVQTYIDCLGTWSGDAGMCTAVRPVNAFFDAQGVDVMQVIIRCRSNYQQKRWDEGSIVLGLLERAGDWQPAVVKTTSLAQMYREGGTSFQTLRKRLAQISVSIDGLTDLDDSTHACLREALYANKWNHNCAELALVNGISAPADSLLTYFEYGTYESQDKCVDTWVCVDKLNNCENHPLEDYHWESDIWQKKTCPRDKDIAATFEHADACESFSGQITARGNNGVTYPKMAWDGDSQNIVPVAELHNKLEGNNELRMQLAKTRLADLLRTKIEPAFAALAAVPMRDIEAEFVSLEGDSLHQTVDCVVLGPYAAADMLPAHKTLRDAFRIPQYHRGSPRSREIRYDVRTQGSETRQSIMREVVQHATGTADAKLRDLVFGVIDALKQAYTQSSNLYCTCLGNAAPSIECCVSNKAMHIDLEQFATTFSAQSVLPKLQDLHGAFTASIADEVTQAKVLHDMWLSVAIVAELSEEDRRVMAKDYAFDYAEPVREYSVNEVPHRINSTLWSYCVSSLESVFFTMPLRVDNDGRVTVDADTKFDPSASTTADARKYMHGMERAIEKILEKAKQHAPTYWSHAHRYVPSDSVWCEETNTRSAPPKRNATYPDKWNDLNLGRQRVAAPTTNELLYVSRLRSMCACGLRRADGSCTVPPGLCALAPQTGNTAERWSKICALGTYAANTDGILVRLALYNNTDLLKLCDESMPSTTWGLLDSKQQVQWYNGSSASQHVSLQEVSTHGPSGVRLAMLLKEHEASNSAWHLPRMPSSANTADAYNLHFEHTIAQPVCRSSQHTLFTEHLGEYFRDVLFPMAHAVHETPSQVICARWVVEYALYVAALEMTGPSSTVTAEQRLVEETWRSRCTYQLEIVAICHLRDVYSLVPAGMQDTKHCDFTLPQNACSKFYVTDTCLLMCDGQLYDPCLCDEARTCNVVFSKDTCARGKRYKPLHVDMHLASMHWPHTVWPPDAQTQRILDAFLDAQVQMPLALHEDMFEFLRNQLAREEGAAPVAFCDDLLDYMDPDTQHPVGYHPTCACDRRETNMRGFDNWMTTVSNSRHAYSIDPVRMRNMSMYSTTFGAAHLTCDAAAYSTSGAQLNPLRMQSRWNANARADPTMPLFADRSQDTSMRASTPSEDQYDTPLQASAASHATFRHSVGLIRDWLRNYENDTDQATLDSMWPHWLDDYREETFAAPSTEALHASCSMPPLLQCYEDSDCTSSDASLRCRRNQKDGAQGDPSGICVHVDTCFQHAHCANGKRLCSGNGVCEQPQIVVRNTLAAPINVRIFAKKSEQCTGSTYGSSVFQHVPTFARDNGLCSVTNLFNYRNLTLGVQAATGRGRIKSINTRKALFIPDALSWLELADDDSDDARNALKMHAHPCDRDYEHTDYAVCAPHNMPIDTAFDALPTFSSTRTWREQRAGPEVDFCKIDVGRGAFNVLTSPYVDYDDIGEPTDTLRKTETTIKPCSQFKFCPSPIHTVSGKLVDRLVFEADTLVKYPLSHAARCMSFGIWDGVKCRVDKLVVPLMRVAFQDEPDVLALETHFDMLRSECPAAFGAERADALYKFQSTYTLLSEPYAPLNELVSYNKLSCERMTDRSIQCVADTINSLVLQIFGLQHQGRGIADINAYKLKARCTEHVFRQLQRFQLDNAKRFSAFDVPPDNAPGAAFYMFTGHFPVEVPLSWFWKCVLIATTADGGAQVDWFDVMTNPALTDRLQCPNVELDATKEVTLRRHLQLQWDIYASDGGSATAKDVYEELLEIMRYAVEFWGITSIPTLLCKELSADAPAVHCSTVSQYSQDDKACWTRLPSKDTTALSFHQEVLTACDKSDKRCTIFDVMFQFIFGRSSKKLRENTVLTVDWMVEQKLAMRIGLDTKTSPIYSYANMIPEVEFARLYDLNASLIHNARPSTYEVDYTGKTECANRLQHAEYELMKRVVDATVGSGEGEFRVYKRILDFREMAEAKEQSLEEVYQSYDIAQQGRTRHVAVSQKHMLLIALYFLRETMYLGTSKTFGTMRYIPDIRDIMQEERVMARDLSQRLVRARFYDSVVKLQNFQCPEDKQISNADVSDLQRQLQACVRELKDDVGWSIPVGKKLVTRANADVFLEGFYVTFAAQQGTTFLDELVNTDWHLHEAPKSGSLCFATPGGASPLVALWAGTLDLFSCPHGKSCGCQLASLEQNTYVDLTCDKSSEIESCKRDFPVFFENVKRAMYDKCWQTQGEFAPGVQNSAGLCNRVPTVPDKCRLEFGAQGGVSGSAMPDLHRRTLVERVQQGLFAQNSSLLRGKRVVDERLVTALQMLATDIGGHSIGLLARPVGSAASRSVVLDVACVSAGRSCAEVSFSTWLSTVASSWAVQHNAHNLRHNLGRYALPTSASLVHWRCPLQWLSAYSDDSVRFAARSPSADRNRVRFSHITGESFYAHATVVETRRVTQHPARFLSDHSACVDALLTDGVIHFRCQGQDLLRKALEAHQGRWTTARFENGMTPNCKSMLDWPHVYARTVDGDIRDKPDASFYCNVFWRLPSFALRYVARDIAVPEKLGHARVPGSACHMGRLRKTRLQETDMTQFCTGDDSRARCRMLRHNSTAQGAKYTWYEHDMLFEAPFSAKRRPAKRQKPCSSCDRHDTASFVDRRNRETPLTNNLNNPAQLSVGQPTTVSTERMLAAALRRYACPDGPTAPCPALYNIFDESTWQRGRLLNAMVDLAAKYQHHNTTPTSDDALWAAPWVHCERIQNVTTCRGNIQKEEWKNPNTRIDACLREMRGPVSTGPSSMDFCSLSEETAELCRKVVEWNNDITHILCSAGNHAKCTSRAFYYNPSQYSASNKDFVYNSIVSLYTKLNKTACPVESEQQSWHNEHNRGFCMSTMFEPTVAIVRLMRLILRRIIMVVYYAIQILFAMYGLVASTLAQAPTATIAYFTENLSKFVNLLLTTIGQALEQIWQIAWTLTDFADLAFIRGLVLFLCYFTQFVIYPFIQIAIVPAMKAILFFLNVLNEALCFYTLGSVCGLIPVDAVQQVHDGISRYRPQECDRSIRTMPGEIRDTLPVATRCWATYNTFYGDSSRLSCTAADTCRRGPTDFSLQMCGACSSFDDNLPFGCYDVTKTCTCNLPRLTEQGCSSNEECAALDATCRFIDRELQPSIGFTKCSSCQTKRVCLVTPGRSDGFCACGLVDIELQRCVAQTKPVMPAYDKLCIYTQDYSFLTTTNYVFSFYTTITAPCNDLNPASTFCARESSDGQLYAVGVDAVRRRHLLSDAGSDTDDAMTAADTYNSLCKDALSSDFMPAHKKACRAAYRYSRETLAQLDLPWTLAPCTFCSVEDAVHALLFEPHNLVMLASNVSRVVLIIMRHSPMHVLVESARQVGRHMNTAVEISKVDPALRIEYANHTWQVQVLVDTPSVDMLARVLRVVLWFAPAVLNTAIPSKNNTSSNQRRLLTVDDIGEAVRQNFRVSAALRQAFASQLASTLDFSFESSASQSEWMDSWPPKIGMEAVGEDLCPPLTKMVRTTRRALQTVDSAYSMQKQAVPTAAVHDAWINVSRRGDANVSWADYSAARATNDAITAGALFTVDRGMALVGLSPNSIFDVLASAADQLWDFVRCDYEAVQTCSKWRVHVLAASVVVGVYYVGVYFLCSAVGLSMPALLAVIVLPSIVLYMSYGYAPLCFPALPVCLYDDLVYSIQQLLPKNIELPSALFRSKQCMAAAQSRIDADCLRRCTDEPFSFLEWYDVLSWWSLELGLEARFVELTQQPWASIVLGQQGQDDIEEAVTFHSRVFNTPDTSLITTNRVCAVVSLYKILPHIALLLICLMLALAAVQVLQQTANVALQTMFALFVSSFY